MLLCVAFCGFFARFSSVASGCCLLLVVLWLVVRCSLIDVAVAVYRLVLAVLRCCLFVGCCYCGRE